MVYNLKVRINWLTCFNALLIYTMCFFDTPRAMLISCMLYNIVYTVLVFVKKFFRPKRVKSTTKIHSSVLKFIFHFIKPRLLLFLILPILFAIQAHSTIIYSQLLQTSLTYIGENANLGINANLIIQPFGLYVLATILMSSAYTCSCLLSGKLLPWFAYHLRGYFFSHILRHSFFYFSQTSTGNIVARINAITSSSIRIIQYIYLELLPSLSVLITASIILFNVSGPLIRIITTWVFIHILIYLLRLNKYVSLSVLNAKLFANLTGTIVDVIENIFTIKLFHSNSFESKYFANTQKIDINSYKRMLLYEKTTYVLMDLFAYMPILSMCFVYFLLKLYLIREISLAGALFIFNTTRSMATQVWKTTAGFGDIVIEVARCTDALNILELPYQLKDKFVDVPLMTDGHFGAINFKSINFVYPESNGGTHSLLFEDFTLSIQPREKVAFVGASGSGKSTIVHLLMRIYDPISGIIEINDQDITKVARDSLGNIISFIPQEPLLFERPIFENIGYGYAKFRNFLFTKFNETYVKFDEIPYELQMLIVEAAKQAEAHEFIISLVNGYDSIYGNEVNLSGGQKQRIIIARAFINKTAQILILDEATSALDPGTDAVISHNIHEMDITVIAVAHKLNLIKNFNRIVVFQSGRIVEQGTHNDLIKQEGKYAALWHAQVDG